MADLTLKGNLTLMGNLNLVGDGGKVLVGTNPVLVEGDSPTNGAQGMAAPVVLIPPPPGAPLVDGGTTAYVVSSFNKNVKAANKPIVAGGILMQGNTPTWPGMMNPSMNNTEVVIIAGTPANVANDQGIIFPSGGTATISQDGQS